MTDEWTPSELVNVAQTNDQIARDIRDDDVDTEHHAFGYNYYRRIAMTARSYARTLLRKGGDDDAW